MSGTRDVATLFFLFRAVIQNTLYQKAGAGYPTPRANLFADRIDCYALIWPAFASIFASTDWISAKPCELCGLRPFDASIELSASL